MMAQTVSSGCVTRRAVLGADSLKVKGGIGDVMVVVSAGWMTSAPEGGGGGDGQPQTNLPQRECR
jgi:hypothetical protein